LFGRLAALVLRHRSPFVAALVVALGLAAWGASQLRIDLSSAAFYGDGEQASAELRAFTERWGHDDGTAIVVLDLDEGDVLEHARLDEVRALADELRGLPEVIRVDAISDHPASAAVAKGSRPARAWLHVPPLVPLLLAQDERATALVVRLGFGSDQLDRTVAAMQSIDEVVARHDTVAGLRMRTGGLPAIRAAFARDVVRDQARLVPACLATVLLLLAVLLRRAWQVAIPAVLALLPTVMLLGAMGWAGAPIGLLSQGYFTLLPVIALADAIHLVTRTGELAERQPGERHTVIIEACRRVGPSCFATSATTAVGFASLSLSSMPMLRAFGGWAAGGVMLSWVVLLVAGPLLLSAMADLRGHRHGIGRFDEALVRATAIARRRPWAVLLLGLALAGAAMWRAREVPVDNRLADLIDPGDPVAQASATIDARLGGVLSLELELVGPPGGFAEPTGALPLAELEDWLAAQPEVRAVVGPMTLLRASGAPLHDAGALQRGWQRLDDAGLREAVLDPSATRARITVRVPDRGGLAFAELEREIVARARAIPGLEVTATGTTALAYHGVNRIAAELQRSLLGAFVVVTLVIAVVFRDLRLGLASLIPNGVPLAIGYAVIAIALGRFDPLGGIVLAVALGIAVDDTIHLVARAREAHAAGDPDPLGAAIRGSGMACTITSLVLAAGLGLFTLSSFPPLRVLGGLGATVILAALVCDLWLLPAVLTVLRWPTRAPGARRESGSR
jgi:uncharacterized protein